MSTARGVRIVLVLPLFLFATGCGGGDKSTKPIVPDDGLPAGTPAADSPEHLAQRLEKTWEFQVESQYALLLTEDFHYTFSAASDPLLVDHYGDTWRKSKEVAAITNLFDGFVDGSDQTIPGASTIDLTLTGVQYGQDPDHPDSTTHYRRIVVAALSGLIEVPGSPDPVTYQVNSRHEFYVVRGDAAVLAGASADTTHWYLRRWDDMAAPFGAAKGPVLNPAASTSLGRIRSLYEAPPPATLDH